MVKSAGRVAVRHTVPVIGVDPTEVPYVRALISLLRHPDPSVPQLARHALEYLSNTAGFRAEPRIPEALPPDRTA